MEEDRESERKKKGGGSRGESRKREMKGEMILGKVNRAFFSDSGCGGDDKLVNTGENCYELIMYPLGSSSAMQVCFS